MKDAASHLSLVLLGVEPVQAPQLLRSCKSIFSQPLGHVDVQDADQNKELQLQPKVEMFTDVSVTVEVVHFLLLN